jgi:hypothetical protein
VHAYRRAPASRHPVITAHARFGLACALARMEQLHEADTLNGLAEVLAQQFVWTGEPSLMARSRRAPPLFAAAPGAQDDHYESAL